MKMIRLLLLVTGALATTPQERINQLLPETNRRRLSENPGQADCTTDPRGVAYDGYYYRSLANALIDDETVDGNMEEHSFLPMPAGYAVAPSTDDIAQNVIAPYYWGEWRMVTETITYCTKSYSPEGGHGYDDAGNTRNIGQGWEVNAQGEYRITFTENWYRLLIRTECGPTADVFKPVEMSAESSSMFIRKYATGRPLRTDGYRRDQHIITKPSCDEITCADGEFRTGDPGVSCLGVLDGYRCESCATYETRTCGDGETLVGCGGISPGTCQAI